MPRAGWLKPVSDRRLSDLVSVGVLTRTFPPGLVDEVIAECGRTEQRHRSLPARVMAYFAIGMALHSECHYAIRTLMWEAADHANVDPDRVSFVAALRIARRSISAARDFSPSA